MAKVEVCADGKATGGEGQMQDYRGKHESNAVGCIIGSKRSVFPYASELGLGALGTVMGMSVDGQAEVEFSHATKLFKEDDLIPVDTGRQRHVVCTAPPGYLLFALKLMIVCAVYPVVPSQDSLIVESSTFALKCGCFLLFQNPGSTCDVSINFYACE